MIANPFWYTALGAWIAMARAVMRSAARDIRNGEDMRVTLILCACFGGVLAAGLAGLIVWWVHG